MEYVLVRRLLMWVAGLSAVALVALAILPVEVLGQSPVVCPFKRFLGFECYGCGMTRAICAFLHGQAQVALAYNRGVLVTLPGLAALALAPLGLFARRGEARPAMPSK